MPDAAIEWVRSPDPVPYPEALQVMEQRVRRLAEGDGRELVWLLEHPPLYTAGTSADERELLGSYAFPVYRVGRGGRFTYHGPGQRVVYLMLDLRRRRPDLRDFVWRLEEWAIRSLARLDVVAERRTGRIGVWVVDGAGGERKIAAVGVRVRRWVTAHGIAINVNPDLAHFDGIVPCGIRSHGVTSLAALGSNHSMAALDEALRAEFGPLLSIESFRNAAA